MQHFCTLHIISSRILYALHTKITSLSFILNNRNTYQSVLTFWLRGWGQLQAAQMSPWMRFCLIDSSSCYDHWDPERASGLMHSLRLELGSGWRLQRRARKWTLESEGGGLQRGNTYKKELLSGSQTSLLCFFIHQSITIQLLNHWWAWMLERD